MSRDADSAAGSRYHDRARRIIEGTPAVRDSVTAATRTFDAHRREAFDELDADALRDWARDVKSHALTHLDRHLEEAETRLTERGARVHWAEDAGDVQRVLHDIVERRGVRSAVKGKSMLSEELGVNAVLEARGVEVLETDLGEYVIQLLGEPPSHIVGPAIHRNLEEIRALFHERLGTPRDGSPEVLARAARDRLRRAFLSADLGITGGNFLVAETGSVALIENEGNIRLTTSLPPVHVALVGIEKVLPRWSDLSTFLQLAARAATGQPLGTFVSMVQGPGGGRGLNRAAAPPEAPGGRGAGPVSVDPVEPDGPEELHVVLVDNGRTRLLADPEAWEALRCIRCGACLNICPVFRQTGGHPYGFAYSGPIGAVLAPALGGLDDMFELPFASSLCGACTEVCPVRIPLHELLHTWRVRAVERGLTPALEGAMMEAYAAVASRPALFRAAGHGLASLPVLDSGRLPVVRHWTEGREGPETGGRTFVDLWREELEAGRGAPPRHRGSVHDSGGEPATVRDVGVPEPDGSPGSGESPARGEPPGGAP